MPQEKYTLEIGKALFAFSVLKKLQAGEVSTFDDRLRSQKIQYLAQLFNVSPSYDFTLYLHGPYSPGLTNDLFALTTQAYSPDLTDFTIPEIEERYRRLEAFVKDKTNRQLELITTLHFFHKVLGHSLEIAIDKLQSIKKASDEEVFYTMDEILKI